ncbi:hypothetical protein [Desulfovibrio inopinatus]|uniref:hypothetical protein n=1 Tax=Desulfovibrio inopinatus TaxID=102109 RepID=UPI0004802C2C|nr:hypothetical protein [Desulfovibrio inopinatus]
MKKQNNDECAPLQLHPTTICPDPDKTQRKATSTLLESCLGVALKSHEFNFLQFLQKLYQSRLIDFPNIQLSFLLKANLLALFVIKSDIEKNGLIGCNKLT